MSSNGADVVRLEVERQRRLADGSLLPTEEQTGPAALNAAAGMADAADVDDGTAGGVDHSMGQGAAQGDENASGLAAAVDDAAVVPELVPTLQAAYPDLPPPDAGRFLDDEPPLPTGSAWREPLAPDPTTRPAADVGEPGATFGAADIAMAPDAAAAEPDTREADTRLAPMRPDSQLLRPAQDELAAGPAAEPMHAGEMLAAAREALGLSHQAVAERTKVPVARLKAIEALHVAGLPVAPYALGFVRAYAAAVDLPPERMVARFRADAGYKDGAAGSAARSGPSGELRTRPQLGWLVIGVAILFLMWVIWRVIEAMAPTSVPSADGLPLGTNRGDTASVTLEAGTTLTDDAGVPPAPALPSPALVEKGVAIARNTTAQAVIGHVAEGVAARAIVIARDPRVDNAPAPIVAVPVLVPVDATETVEPAPTRPPETTPAAAEPTPPVSTNTITGTPAPGIDGGTGTAPASEPVAETPRTDAIMRRAVEPVYPARCESAAAAEEAVTVTFVVTRTGKVADPAVVASTNSCFDSSAMAAIMRWEFDPARQGDTAVEELGRTARVVFTRPE